MRRTARVPEPPTPIADEIRHVDHAAPRYHYGPRLPSGRPRRFATDPRRFPARRLCRLRIPGRARSTPRDRAAGIKTVTYIEPYPKSRALDLHQDSISLEDEREGKVVFRPFVGVAPRAYERLFSMTSWDGSRVQRKDDAGVPILDRVCLRFRMPYLSALQRESLAAKELIELTPKEERR